jgi:hypothetical protein
VQAAAAESPNTVRQRFWLGYWNGKREGLNQLRQRHRRAEAEKKKKEEFPGFMENMLPGNSFPQICVVSVNQSVGNVGLNMVKMNHVPYFLKKLKEHVLK